MHPILDVQAHTGALLWPKKSPVTGPLSVGHSITLIGILWLMILLLRLKVPAIRSVLEYLKYVFRHWFKTASSPLILSFVILFILFILAIELNEVDRINAAELVFIIYTLGFTLEKFAAMQEHGLRGTSIGFNLHQLLFDTETPKYTSQAHGSATLCVISWSPFTFIP